MREGPIVSDDTNSFTLTLIGLEARKRELNWMNSNWLKRQISLGRSSQPITSARQLAVSLPFPPFFSFSGLQNARAQFNHDHHQHEEIFRVFRARIWIWVTVTRENHFLLVLSLRMLLNWRISLFFAASFFNVFWFLASSFGGQAFCALQPISLSYPKEKKLQIIIFPVVLHGIALPRGM